MFYRVTYTFKSGRQIQQEYENFTMEQYSADGFTAQWTGKNPKDALMYFDANEVAAVQVAQIERYS